MSNNTSIAKHNTPANPVAMLVNKKVEVVRWEPDGVVKAFRAKIDLAPDQYCTIAKKLVPVKKAFDAANQMAGITVQMPASIIVDGMEQTNPYTVKKPNGMISSVFCAAQAIGYGPTGRICVTEATVYFNLYSYYVQAIQSQMKRVPDLGTIGSKNHKPTINRHRPYDGEEREVKLGTTLEFLEIEDPIGLWVDFTHPAFRSILEEHSSRQKFGDRIAQTIAERNAIGKHPAFGGFMLKRGKDGGVYGTVIAWAAGSDAELRRVADLAKNKGAAAARDAGADAITVDAEEITYESHAADVDATTDDERAGASRTDAKGAVIHDPADISEDDALDMDDDPIDDESDAEEQDPTPPPANEREIMGLLSSIFKAREFIGKSKFAEVCRSNGYADATAVKSEKDTAKLAALNAALLAVNPE